MSMLLKGSLAQRVKALTGGKVNEDTVSALLDELEARRGAEDEDALAGMAMPKIEQVTPSGFMPETPRPEDEEDDAAEQAEPEPAPPAKEEPPQATASPEVAALKMELEALRGKLADAAKGHKVDDVERAVGAGKLPIPSMMAPPLGLTGLGDIPRGKWMLSPFGPKVNYIICGCRECSPARLTHWYCVMCKTGPYHFRQRYPHMRKNHMAPGGIWGISHEVCSEPCRINYLSVLGVIAGVNDHEPPQVPNPEGGPLRPVTTHDSD